MIAGTLRDHVEFRGVPFVGFSGGNRLGSLQYRRNTLSMRAADRRNKKEKKKKEGVGDGEGWVGGKGEKGTKGRKKRKQKELSLDPF